MGRTTPAPGAAVARAGGVVVLALALARLVTVLALGPGSAGADGEEDLERGLEGPPVRRRLDQGGGQRVLQPLAVLEGDVADGLGRIEVLGQRDRQAGPAQ